ncbi:uncharacterized protein K489DRAFT_71979 [Dissoconium aciculare CBS 342.82]|uniref:Uncharacterized protein n=1 Tax=Dissoconium aciculare CBS 342.82 TaxID=1314786 RepID=A0A6J3LYF7_9PEZI|nr:uncharacterized protein K489DRAFT_71979 [Dissoconium aciculare CBS 342.82]KAF1819657.1 hypothetical protein K489DRAFT_71979 [Dissoconium aciculare CBS 342.82]
MQSDTVAWGDPWSSLQESHSCDGVSILIVPHGSIDCESHSISNRHKFTQHHRTPAKGELKFHPFRPGSNVPRAKAIRRDPYTACSPRHAAEAPDYDGVCFRNNFQPLAWCMCSRKIGAWMGCSRLGCMNRSPDCRTLPVSTVGNSCLNHAQSVGSTPLGVAMGEMID